MLRVKSSRFRWSLDGEGDWLGIQTPDARKVVAGVKDGKVYEIVIKQHVEKRSLDANAYAWALIGELAAKLSTDGAPVSPDDVYRHAIRDVGGNYEVMPIRNDALEHWKLIWTSKGTGWLCDDLGPSKIDGYTNVRHFYGSSVYDKAQMSRLINIIVEECKAQGIETLPPEKLAAMSEEWGGKRGA